MRPKLVDHLYNEAKERVVRAGYGQEFLWQEEILGKEFTESDLLREGAWVILCGGFKEAIVRNVFPTVSLCFCDWESAKLISEKSKECRATALSAFANERKIDGILKFADRIADLEFSQLLPQIKRSPIEELMKFPYIGPITSYHLAEILGFDVAKPDRHLTRLARRHGYRDVHTFCSEISRRSGDAISVVDIILWRYAVLSKSAASQ